MAAAQEIQQSTSSSDQTYEENVPQEVEQEEYLNAEETAEETQKQAKTKKSVNNGENRVEFVNGLFVGVGAGCIATFVITWISLFFTPQLPQAISYQNMLSVFIYPLIYLLAVGLVALTAGVVREYYSAKRIY
jgi:threonine/homoserine/homoserine lactone efflux protein